MSSTNDAYKTLHKACPIKKGDTVKVVRSWDHGTHGYSRYSFESEVADGLKLDTNYVVSGKNDDKYTLGGGLFYVPYFALELVESAVQTQETVSDDDKIAALEMLTKESGIKAGDTVKIISDELHPCFSGGPTRPKKGETHEVQGVDNNLVAIGNCYFPITALEIIPRSATPDPVDMGMHTATFRPDGKIDFGCQTFTRAEVESLIQHVKDPTRIRMGDYDVVVAWDGSVTTPGGGYKYTAEQMGNFITEYEKHVSPETATAA